MFEAAITADPAHVKAMGNLAAVRIGAARHAEAVALLERALSVSEMEQGKLVADLAVALGSAHEAAGGGEGASKDSLEAAHRAYSRALHAHPSHAGAAAQLAALVRIAPRSSSRDEHAACSHHYDVSSSVPQALSPTYRLLWLRYCMQWLQLTKSNQNQI